MANEIIPDDGKTVFDRQAEKSQLEAKQLRQLRAKLRRKADRIVDRLVKFIDDEIKMSPAQVSASKIILDKVIPSLQAVEYVEPKDASSINPVLMRRKIEELLRKNPELAKHGTTIEAIDVTPRKPPEKATEAP